MKIIVKTKEKKEIRLWFPTRLLFSKTIARIIKKHVKPEMIPLNHLASGEEVCVALKALRNMKRDHPGTPLVEVKSEEGDYVLVSM
ncbi:MAG TPA: hypothetical protein GX734_01995 [Clostridiaceae bacterium]|nr:hypothetical protein [Clostridiaceae bacterium]